MHLFGTETNTVGHVYLQLDTTKPLQLCSAILLHAHNHIYTYIYIYIYMGQFTTKFMAQILIVFESL